MLLKSRFALGFYCVAALSCSPKLGQQTTVSPKAEPVQQKDAEEPNGPCITFDQSTDKETALNAHVIYRDFLRTGEYDQAFPYWEKAYALAPAADGKRNTHFADGIKFYEHFYAKESDQQKKEAYVDQIFDFYDQIEKCYGEAGYVSGRKAFDLYYKYKDRASQDEIYQLFTTSLDLDGMDSHFFILNPFTDLLVRRFRSGEITQAEAQKYAQLITERLEKGLASGENKAQWEIIQEYVPKRLEAFEGTRGFYSCEYYVAKYFPTFIQDSNNCETIEEVYGRLRWGGCDDNQEEIQQLAESARRQCMEKVPASGARLAYEALREGNYDEAVALFEQAVDEAEENDRKANYLLVIAKIYYSHLKDFPQAKKYALEAANYRANWGEPYLLIGRLYASSGPICGPGRGWDSQIVVWPAIDKWMHAKRIDPESAEEADKYINRYTQYMPSKEDVFQRNLEQGQKFRVGCWIQENTTIRSPK